MDRKLEDLVGKTHCKGIAYTVLPHLVDTTKYFERKYLQLYQQCRNCYQQEGEIRRLLGYVLNNKASYREHASFLED